MKKTLVIIAFVLLAVLTAVLCALSVLLFLNNKELKTEIETLKATVEEDDDTDSEENSDVDTDEDTTEDSEDADCEKESDDGETIVTSPCDGDIVDNILVIKGSARAFESTILVEVNKTNGTNLYKKVVTVDAADVGLFGDFLVSVDTSGYADGDVVVKVYSESAKDGSDQSVVEVPVTIGTF